MSGSRKPEGPLRRGWTTGACATAATKAACTALATGTFPDPVTIVLPKGDAPAFPLAHETMSDGSATAAIVKDAGDDPDVTHGATIFAQVRPAPKGSGVTFRAGEGVGTVTKPGLPVPVGEPAINPVPRELMRGVVAEVAHECGGPRDVEITISVPGGEAMAAKTWNPRLGILGGISILGTTGVVHPFSCAAWIHSIHRGIDVARAVGHERVLGATGSTSEATALAVRPVPTTALLDMGDFAGGLLKYLRAHPVANLTLAGGFAKMTKLAQGALDLHSGRSQVDLAFLLKLVPEAGEFREAILHANTAAEVLALAQSHGWPLPERVAERALATVRATLGEAPVQAEVMVVARDGRLLAHVQ